MCLDKQLSHKKKRRKKNIQEYIVSTRSTKLLFLKNKPIINNNEMAFRVTSKNPSRLYAKLSWKSTVLSYNNASITYNISPAEH